MKRFTLLALLAAALALPPISVAAAPGADGAPLLLTQGGQPRATIVLAEKPTGSAQLAAQELQHYLKKISGALLPIAREPQAVKGATILVGEGKAALALGYSSARLAEQEYVVKRFPNTLLLIGRDAQEFLPLDYDDFRSVQTAVSGGIGTCYAVHAFLENTLGVHWYYPNEKIGEVVPALPNVSVGNVQVRRTPDALVRSIYPFFANTEKLYFSDWDQTKKFSSSDIDARQSLLYWVRNRMWGDLTYNANHSFHGYDKAFGQSHPEWFSTKSYDRMSQLDYQTDIQPCLAAPGFKEKVIDVARDYFNGKPEPFIDAYRAASGNFFPIVPNDNTNMCGCPLCRPLYTNNLGPEGSASHYTWNFVNDVAREVRKTNPKAMVSGLAYFNYTTPPGDLIFEPNVAVTFCKFYTCYNDPSYQKRDYQLITDYVTKNKARFFTTWEYQIKPGMTEGAFPCLVPHIHAADVKRLSEIGGFRGGTNQYLALTSYDGETPGVFAWASPVMDFMNMYWRMKLYDDFKYDVDKGLGRYYSSFFGPGGESMKKFYGAMEQRWMKFGGNDSRSWWGKMGTPDFLKEVGGYVQEAKDKTQEGSLYRKRVELIDAGILQHLWKNRAAYEKSAMSEFAPVGTAAVARAEVPAGADWADDATWRDSMTGEIRKTIANEPAPEKTFFQLAWDHENLYIKARCMESRMDDIKAATHDRDIGGFSDDSLEMFIDAPGTGRTYYQFCINSLGAVYDALENPTAIGATATVTWDSGIKVKTVKGDNYWEVRAALPLASVTKRLPEAGSTWRFNLARNRFAAPGEPPFSAWSATLGGFRNAERFGIITFNDAEERGRLIWNSDFQGEAFAAEAGGGAAPLIGFDGWYENTSYANRGWDKSWSVTGRGGRRTAVVDINATNPSDTVPMHAVQIRPGVVSVEVNYRRSLLENQPTLSVYDANGRQFAYMYAWSEKNDMVAIELPGNRQVFDAERHGLAQLTAIGRWFGLRLDIDAVRKNLTGYVRSGEGAWVRLNDQPLPWYNPQAEGDTFFLSLGTYKLNDGARENNFLEMDGVRVIQVSADGVGGP